MPWKWVERISGIRIENHSSYKFVAGDACEKLHHLISTRNTNISEMGLLLYKVTKLRINVCVNYDLSEAKKQKSLNWVFFFTKRQHQCNCELKE